MNKTPTDRKTSKGRSMNSRRLLVPPTQPLDYYRPPGLIERHNRRAADAEDFERDRVGTSLMLLFVGITIAGWALLLYIIFN